MKNYSEKYIGRSVQLYPNDTYKKCGIITNADEWGFTIKITESTQSDYYVVGNEYFYSHSAGLKLMFLD